MQVLSLYTVGAWDVADSYGKIATELACYLTGQASSRPNPHHGGVDLAGRVRVNCIGLGPTVVESQPEELRIITGQPVVPVLGGIAMGWPVHFPKMSGLLHAGPRIALTMFESSKLPAAWVPILNDFDAVIVPSHFCAEVFLRSGVTRPIHVIPLGVSPMHAYRKRPAPPPLTFLAFLDRGERKGGEVALQAFVRAFGDDPDYRLILKGRKSKVALRFTNPNIEVIQCDMSEAELAELYRRCHVLINPHKGEGFGLIPREFAATGGVALTTGWSGTADGLDFWGVPIPYTLQRAGWQGNKSIEGQDVGEWATVDPAVLAELLWDVVDNWPRQQSRALMRAEFVAAQYRWDRFGEQVYQVWQEVTTGVRSYL